jgi:hypothetical protein
MFLILKGNRYMIKNTSIENMDDEKKLIHDFRTNSIFQLIKLDDI